MSWGPWKAFSEMLRGERSCHPPNDTNGGIFIRFSHPTRPAGLFDAVLSFPL